MVRLDELTLLVANQISGMKSMQRGMGTPIKIVRAWTDVIIPDGPPPEFERSGYADNWLLQ